jgi:AmmeMemoRadiSam system protein B
MTRKPIVAGSFYPSDSEELSTLLDNFFRNTREKLKGKNIKALIVPHAGYVYSGQTAAWGYKQISTPIKSGSKVNPDQIGVKKTPHFILIGPSHNYYFQNIVSNNFVCWDTPLGRVQHIVPDNRKFSIYNEAFVPEHCLEVQLPFIQHIIKDFSITCLLTGTRINYEKIANDLIKHYSSSMCIISSDLSHYLPQRQAQDTDKKTIDAITCGDIQYFQTHENVACGAGGISIILEIAKKLNWKSERVYYDTSATSSGDTSGVVGYVSIAFYK